MNFKQAVLSLALIDSIVNGNNNKNFIHFDFIKRNDKFKFKLHHKRSNFKITWKKSVWDIITDPRIWML